MSKKKNTGPHRRTGGRWRGHSVRHCYLSTSGPARWSGPGSGVIVNASAPSTDLIASKLARAVDRRLFWSIRQAVNTVARSTSVAPPSASLRRSAVDGLPKGSALYPQGGPAPLDPPHWVAASRSKAGAKARERFLPNSPIKLGKKIGLSGKKTTGGGRKTGGGARQPRCDTKKRSYKTTAPHS